LVYLNVFHYEKLHSLDIVLYSRKKIQMQYLQYAEFIINYHKDKAAENALPSMECAMISSKMIYFVQPYSKEVYAIWQTLNGSVAAGGYGSLLSS
jgi:hypothetical protein